MRCLSTKKPQISNTKKEGVDILIDRKTYGVHQEKVTDEKDRMNKSSQK